MENGASIAAPDEPAKAAAQLLVRYKSVETRAPSGLLKMYPFWPSHHIATAFAGTR